MRRAWGLIAAAFFFVTLPAARAQSSWDSVLAGSEWCVPSRNLLAYLTSGSDLNDVEQIADQTIWDISTCVNGAFSGNSTETFLIDGFPVSATSTMSGVVNEIGQIRIIFTESSGSQTVGIGQIKIVEDAPAMQMQMISGSSSYITHWADMVPYDGNPASLPPLVIPDVTIDQEWSWMKNTNWIFQDSDLFGEGETGNFQIQDYDNGFFWGSGTGPEGSAAENYTLLGSATPEGTILFNIVSGTTLTSLIGQITGSAADGEMGLRVYDTSGNLGELGTAMVVPEPSALGLLGGGGLLLVLAGLVRHRAHRLPLASRNRPQIS